MSIRNRVAVAVLAAIFAGNAATHAAAPGGQLIVDDEGASCYDPTYTRVVGLGGAPPFRAGRGWDLGGRVAVNDSGTQLAASLGATVQLIDLRDGRTRQVSADGDVQWSRRGGTLLAAGDTGGTVIRRGAVAARLPALFSFSQLAPDGRAVSGSDFASHGLVVATASGGWKTRRLPAPERPGEDGFVAWSPDGRSVAYATSDFVAGTFVVHVADAATAVVRDQPRAVGEVADLEWSGDGRKLAVITDLGNVPLEIVDRRTGTARSSAGRSFVSWIGAEDLLMAGATTRRISVSGRLMWRSPLEAVAPSGGGRWIAGTLRRAGHLVWAIADARNGATRIVRIAGRPLHASSTTRTRWLGDTAVAVPGANERSLYLIEPATRHADMLMRARRDRYLTPLAFIHAGSRVLDRMRHPLRLRAHAADC